MLSRYQHQGITWVDLESPSRGEVQEVVEVFGIDPMVAEELLLPSTKPRTEFHKEYVYTILHFPALRHSHKSKEQEIDFIVGKNFVITTRYDMIDPLHKFSKLFEVDSMLDKGNIGDHAGYLFYFMLRRMYKSIEHEIEYVQHELLSIEEHIFSGHEVAMVAAISGSARDLLNMRQTIEPHRDVLRTLEEDGKLFFGEAFAPFLHSLSNEYYRVHNHIMRSTESLHELRETNNSLITTKQNEIMKTFTILAFVTFPLSLIAAIFAMDLTGTPFIGSKYDFWKVMTVMAGAALIMFAYFRHKKWL